MTNIGISKVAQAFITIIHDHKNTIRNKLINALKEKKYIIEDCTPSNQEVERPTLIWLKISVEEENRCVFSEFIGDDIQNIIPKTQLISSIIIENTTDRTTVICYRTNKN